MTDVANGECSGCRMKDVQRWGRVESCENDMKEVCSAERDDIVGNKVAPLTILPGGFGGRKDLSAFDRERDIRGMLSLSASVVQ